MPEKSEKVPRIYVDTNFILDCTEGRSRHSVHLIEQIREQKWGCVTSIFSILEIVDNTKDSIFISKKLRQRWTINKIRRGIYIKNLSNEDFKEVEKYIENKVLNTYPFLKSLVLTEQGWRAALDLGMHSNISAPDIMHLATAWDSKCNVLVTSDEHFINESKKLIKNYPQLQKIKIEICRPNEVIGALKQMGFNI